jgi:hypothetical protein
MKNLLYKELRLCMNVQICIFLGLGPFMMLIPNYPHYVGFYYSCLSIFLLFTWGMANNDIVYTACLPVRRSDIVKARFLSVVFLELTEIIVSIPFGIAGNILMPQGNKAGINTTTAFYGIQFVLYSLFNVFFLIPCYRKIEKPALPFLGGSIAFWAGYAAAELPVWSGSAAGRMITATDAVSQLKQLPVLAAGILVWCAALLVSFRICVKEFDKVNL